MSSPFAVTVLRIRKNQPLSRRSIRDISGSYFKKEHARFSTVELIVFAVLTAVALWPIVSAAAAIEKYLG